jgi:hypothetical protein
MLDEERFFSPFGIRSLARWHLAQPYAFSVAGHEYAVQYMPAESTNAMFGGNSNWRGPVWFPINFLIIRALVQFYLYYGDSFRIECPTGSGKMMNLWDVGRPAGGRIGASVAGGRGPSRGLTVEAMRRLLVRRHGVPCRWWLGSELG